MSCSRARGRPCCASLSGMLAAGVVWALLVGGVARAQTAGVSPGPTAAGASTPQALSPQPPSPQPQTPPPVGQRLERRRERLQRFLDALPEAEREQYQQRIDELERGREAFPHLAPVERRELLAKARALREELQARRFQAREELRALPPAERREVIRKLRTFRDLPPAEQQELRERYHMLRALTPAERKRLQENARRWNAMPLERRQQLRELQRRLRALSPEERQKLMDTLGAMGKADEKGQPPATSGAPGAAHAASAGATP